MHACSAAWPLGKTEVECDLLSIVLIPLLSFFFWPVVWHHGGAGNISNHVLALCIESFQLS